MKFLMLLLTVILLSVGGCATTLQAQRAEPVQPTQTQEVLAWGTTEYLENGNELGVWMMLMPSVQVILPNGEETILCTIGAVVTDKDTGQLIQRQMSATCWYSVENRRWLAASAWTRWTPTGLVYDTFKIEGYFYPETGWFKQGDGQPFWLERVNL